MKISRLIKKLKKAQKYHGDIDVRYFHNDNADEYYKSSHHIEGVVTIGACDGLPKYTLIGDDRMINRYGVDDEEA